MADRYIDETYVSAALGADLVRALLEPSGTNLGTMIENATDFIKSQLRNSGYSIPSPVADPSVSSGLWVTLSDITVKLAVLSGVRRALSMLPESSLELPTDYDKSDENQARVGIITGNVTLSLPLSNIQAVGGWGFTSTTSRPDLASRTGRCQLKGY